MQLKDETLKDLREFENSIKKHLEESLKTVNQNIGANTEKIIRLSDNLNSLLNTISINQTKVDKINELERFTKKTEIGLSSHELRITNTLNEIQKIKFKYDKIILDNLYVPGFVGTACHYKTLSEFLTIHIQEFSRLQAEKEILKKDIRDLKIKHEQVLKSITSLTENSYERGKEYTDHIQKSFQSMLDVKLKEFNEKTMEIRMNVCKIQMKSEEEIGNLKMEFNKVLDMRGELIYLIDQKKEEILNICKDFEENINKNMNKEFENNLQRHKNTQSEIKYIQNIVKELVKKYNELRKEIDEKKNADNEQIDNNEKNKEKNDKNNEKNNEKNEKNNNELRSKEKKPTIKLKRERKNSVCEIKTKVNINDPKINLQINQNSKSCKRGNQRRKTYASHVPSFLKKMADGKSIVGPSLIPEPKFLGLIDPLLLKNNSKLTEKSENSFSSEGKNSVKTNSKNFENINISSSIDEEEKIFSNDEDEDEKNNISVSKKENKIKINNKKTFGKTSSNKLNNIKEENNISKQEFVKRKASENFGCIYNKKPDCTSSKDKIENIDDKSCFSQDTNKCVGNKLSESLDKNKCSIFKKNENNKEENDSMINSPVAKSSFKIKNDSNNSNDFKSVENNDINNINNLNKNVSNIKYLAYTNSVGITNKTENKMSLNKNLSKTTNDINPNIKNKNGFNTLYTSTNFYRNPASMNINSSLSSRVNNANQTCDNDFIANNIKANILSRNFKSSNNNLNVACETNNININSKNKIQVVSLDPNKMINMPPVKTNGSASFPGKKITKKHLIRDDTNPLDELYKIQYQKKLDRLEKIKNMNQDQQNDIPKKIVPAFGRTAYAFFNKKEPFDVNSPIKAGNSKSILKQISTSENILNAKMNHPAKIKFNTESIFT